MIRLARKPRQEPAATLRCRLLDRLIGGDSLEGREGLVVLDFGRASQHSIDFFAPHGARLQIIDAAESLAPWAQPPAASADDGERKDYEESLYAICDRLAPQRADLVFLWDTVNRLAPEALPTLFRFISHRVHDGFAGHGFMRQREAAGAVIQDYGVLDAECLRPLPDERCAVRPHTRKAVSDAMQPLAIDHGVLHSDGRLEFLFRRPRERPRVSEWQARYL